METVQVVLGGVHGSALGAQIVSVREWSGHFLENQLEIKQCKRSVLQ